MEEAATLHLTLRQLQIFVAVAQAGSTAAAAPRVALSQSATSAALIELERLLGLRLFERAGRSLRLNDNGRALLPRARALLQGAGAIERLTGDAPLLDRELRIGATTTLGNYVLPRLLARFFGAGAGDAGTQWRSRVAIGNLEAICGAVGNFELDVGLIEGTSHLPQLRAMPWLRDELIVVAAPDRCAALAPPGRRAGLRTLREAVWLLREPGSGTRQATDQLLLPHLRSYRRSIEIASSEAIQRGAAAGLGLACLSRWVVQDALAAGRLQALPTVLPTLLRQCHCVVHRDKELTPALQRFLRLVQEENAP